MSTPVHAVATSLNTCRASRTCRARRRDRVAPCCPTRATQHVTTFSCAKMRGLDSVSFRVVTQQVKFGNDYWNKYVFSLWQKSAREADD